jgi:pimeloyl-ACP methyl ester carboxylesterase
MRDSRCRRYRVCLLLLTLAPVCCASGCLARLNPLPELTSAERVTCQALRAADRDRVHVFFINGLDPLDKGNLVGLSDRVRELGFQNVAFGQMYDEPAMRREIVRVHAQDPGAKIVVVGFSFGANLARVLADQLQAENIPVELLVYLGGDTLTNSPEDRPANARQIVNITAEGCSWLFAGLIWKGEDIDGAENLRLEHVDHFHIPTNEQVLQMLRERLAGVVAAGPRPGASG